MFSANLDNRFCEHARNSQHSHSPFTFLRHYENMVCTYIQQQTPIQFSHIFYNLLASTIIVTDETTMASISFTKSNVDLPSFSGGLGGSGFIFVT